VFFFAVLAENGQTYQEAD